MGDCCSKEENVLVYHENPLYKSSLDKEDCGTCCWARKKKNTFSVEKYPYLDFGWEGENRGGN